ncbi:TetR/AcrR family transcriptional regulator [Nonomuraea sp. NPDC050556]|uniref:TetR/AcrR family transcriptional regulator n=1 Tax=Nonomuraea sp. NPDC050556 TaxID=3364369 RepID=UPI003795936D
MIESGSRGRTRRAILSATASVLARDRSATLADIARAADVGRTTLHRYFPDRDELVRAAIVDSFAAVEESVKAAAIDQGPVPEAMRRLVAALVDVADRLAFMFGDPRMLEQLEAAGWAPDMSVPTTVSLIERGQAEGVFDPEVGAEWVEQVLWALVYTGWEAAEKGKLPKHGVTAVVIRTLESGILARHES